MEPRATFSDAARRLGVVSAIGVTILCPAYAAVLVAGLLSLPTPQDPIGEPVFGILEILILFLAPLMLMLAASIHAWADERSKIFGVMSLAFMSLMAVLTCSIHFVVLTISRDPAIAAMESAQVLLAFKWPSIVYALDILAWDVLFALSAVFAAPVFGGSRLGTWIRRLLFTSGVLAFAGLTGVVQGDMQLRNIGILGYVLVYPVAAALVALLFVRAKPCQPIQP
jgi:hypothetical protein